jgi:hypothetical protein
MRGLIGGDLLIALNRIPHVGEVAPSDGTVELYSTSLKAEQTTSLSLRLHVSGCRSRRAMDRTRDPSKSLS